MYDFNEIEKQAGKILDKKDIKKAVSDNKKKKLFSFLEGPPTANAPPALHHLEVRTFKDIINKFKFMQGFSVPRKAGWDCHGLPVEVQIEKKLKLNNKKDILKFGEKKFIEECRASVFSYIKEWNKSTKRLNYWIDLENPYVTLDNNYIESEWWSLKKLYEKKLLYEAHKVVPFCPRCETPLSSHEVAQGYKKIKEDAVIVKMKADSGEYLLVFTTTPWTLPSNLAIAVNPNIDYAYVEERGVYIVAKELASKMFEDPKIIKVVKGKELIGKKYEPLFNYFTGKGAFKIISGDFVTEEDGTGLVHMAPAFGEVDYDACKSQNIPFFQPVDETGKFTEEVPEYRGKFVKDTDKEIIIRLEKEEKLFKKFKYEHDYPFCWRCDTPLLYYAINSWFIRVTDYKEKMIKLNEKINWVPKHIKDGRFGDWLENVRDWALSRKKFWGTPLPVWRCPCGHEEIIGSIEELKKRSAKKILNKDIDLHKPWIDSIKFNCPKCKKEMSRVSEVIDTWYDSGSASYAQFHYPFENKKEFEKRFPYDFIAEAIDQTRGWFYTLHVLSTVLFDNIAYRNVICAGHIVDEKGEKMSKSKGNILNPDVVLDSVGVDATRMQFCTADIGSFKKFGIELVKKDIFGFMNVLWNTFQFYQQINNTKKAETKIEDKWILSRMNSVIKEATESLENYQIEKGLLPVMDFIVNDFSKTYIKIIRDREDKNTKKVIGEVLENVAKLLAPYAPNITEVIYSEFGSKSIHLSAWPKPSEKAINKNLEEKFSIVAKIIESGLRERDKAQIGLKWPLPAVIIYLKNKADYKEFEEIIKSQLNVKQIRFETPAEKETIFVLELDKQITPELEAEGFAREISRAVQSLRKKAELVKTQHINLEIITESKEKLLDNIKFIKERTNSKSIYLSEIPSKSKFTHKEELKIKGINFIISLKKV